MYEYLPLLIAGAFIGLFTLLFFIAYLIFKRKKYNLTSDRKMSDREITKRLLAYAKPYRGKFVFVIIVMALSTAYDLLSPVLVGR